MANSFYSFFDQSLQFATADQARSSIRSSNGLFILRQQTPFGNRLFSITNTGVITDLGDMNETGVGDVFSEGTLHTDGLVYLLSRAEGFKAVFDLSTNSRTIVYPTWYQNSIYSVGAFASDQLTGKLYMYSSGDGVYEITPYGSSETLDIVGSRVLALDSTYDNKNTSIWFYGNYFIVCKDGDDVTHIYNKSDFSLYATSTKGPNDFQIFSGDMWYYLRLDGNFLGLYQKDMDNLTSDFLLVSVELPQDSISPSILGATAHGDYITCAMSGITSTPILVLDLSTPPTQVEAPVITPQSVSHSESFQVSITCSTDGASIRYTLDGTEPTTESTLYDGQFLISLSVEPTIVTVQAKAFHESLTASVTAVQNYELSGMQTAVTPTIVPEPGVYEGSVSVTLTCDTSDVSIHYTLDGTTPNETSALYVAPFNLNAPFDNTVSAIAIRAGYIPSAVNQQSYTVLTPLEAPVFSPESDTYAVSVEVTLSAEPGCEIWYTFDDPTEATWIQYSEPLLVTNDVTITARSTLGTQTSSYSQASYVISLYQKKNSVLLYDFAFGIST